MRIKPMKRLIEETEITRKFDAAMAARDRNDLVEARRLLGEVVADPATDQLLLSGAYCQLGYISGTLLNEVRVAVDHFTRAVEAQPRMELCSLGLFHALVRVDAWEEALDEAFRYLSLRDSSEYGELFFDGYADGLSPRAQEIFRRVRDVMAARLRDGQPDSERPLVTAADEAEEEDKGHHQQ